MPVARQRHHQPRYGSGVYVLASMWNPTHQQLEGQELDIDMSDKVRETIANLVRNHKRQTAKPDK